MSSYISVFSDSLTPAFIVLEMKTFSLASLLRKKSVRAGTELVSLGDEVVKHEISLQYFLRKDMSFPRAKISSL